ncbi:MAG TPA: alpha/beta hydrolase [Aggregatilineales bacterium]|nr:alpha/beta hydrolase [Aggregatilineales bacterium]
MQTLQVSGQTLFYETLGAGDPLLLIHGFAQVGRDLHLLARALAANYTVILPDVPGYGRSAPPFRTFPADFYQRDAALLGAFLDSIGQKKVHILGFSDGGEIALLLPIARPDLCRTAIAWGAVGSFDRALCGQVRRRMTVSTIDDGIRSRHPGQNTDAWPDQWVDTFCAIAAAGGDVSLSRAPEIACPVLLMDGSNDALNPAVDGQRFIDAVGCPHKRFEVFAGAGHYLHTEQPARFIRLVREFLRSPAGAEGRTLE